MPTQRNRWIDFEGERSYVGPSLLQQLAALEAGPVAEADYLPLLKRGTVRLYLTGMGARGWVYPDQRQRGVARAYSLTDKGRRLLAYLQTQLPEEST